MEIKQANSMVPKIPRYDAMTGITQSQPRPSMTRPASGIQSYATIEPSIDGRL